MRLVAVSIVFATATAIAVPAFAAPPDKVTICHRTNATKNPYQQIAVAVSSVDGTGGKGDHYLNHIGPVWTPEQPNGGDWGDIIPPIAGVHSGLNWNAWGQAIYAAGCAVAAYATKPDTGKPGDAKPGDNTPDAGKPDTATPTSDEPGAVDPGRPEEEEIAPELETGKGGDEETSIWVIEDPADEDTDGDGRRDAADTDDDQDGILDAADGDDNGDGVPESREQEVVRVELPQEIAPGEPVLVAREGEVTDAGSAVRTVLTCRPKARSLAAGDIGSPTSKRLCRVTKVGKRYVLEVYGITPTTVRIKRTAGASGAYGSMTEVRTYTVR